MAAAAGIHRGDELEARGIAHMRVGAGDRDASGLDRLAQRLQGRALELRQLVEEEHALMREARSRPAWRGGRRRPAPAARPNDADRGRAARAASLPSSRPPATEWIMLTSSASAGSRAAGCRAAAAPASTCRCRAGRSSGRYVKLTQGRDGKAGTKFGVNAGSDDQDHSPIFQDPELTSSERAFEPRRA